MKENVVKICEAITQAITQYMVFMPWLYVLNIIQNDRDMQYTIWGFST